MISRLLLALLALLACIALAAPAQAQKRIAFSFDDVPRAPGGFMTVEERTTRLIAALRRAGIRQAAFFVTPGHLQQPWGPGGEARIDRYVRAGHVIANHSFTHPSLSRVGAEAYLADIDRAAAWLQGRRGYRPWFRYPFLDEGTRGTPDMSVRDAVRAGLAQRGLANGYVTIDSYDWYLDSLATRARQAGQTLDMAALRDLYVRIVVETAEWQDRLSREALHRQPVHVVLMHETDLEALFLADAVRALRARGWRIATIDEAYRDPIARVAPDTRYLGGGRVTAIAAAADRNPRDLIPPLNEEAEIQRLFNERVLRQGTTQ
ncbi:MAG TPA: polysaccharide deacetylase family protein [Allosphingosinicella sp.]|nr:polysaccharide deacetylase family protein [Allosphingosinicella sp.]